MIPLTRPPMPDELWWSVLSRHAELVGPSRVVLRHEWLVGNRRSLGSPLYPRQLDTLVDALGLNLSSPEIIARHSMLPLYRSFVRARKITRATAAMRENGNAEMLLGLTTMADYPLTLRICPKCREAERGDYGAAIWHRAHQGPGVIVCHRHQCPLATTSVSCRFRPYFAPTTADSVSSPKPIHVPTGQFKTALGVARDTYVLLNDTIPQVDQAQLASLYRERLRVVGLVDSHDRLRHRDFIESFLARFGSFLDLIGCIRPSLSDRDNWLARLVRRPRADQSPLRHIVLMQYLGVPADDAMAEAATLASYVGRAAAEQPPLRRSALITEERVRVRRIAWLFLLKTTRPGPVREQNDTLYSWLWRNDRQWLLNVNRTIR